MMSRRQFVVSAAGAFLVNNLSECPVPLPVTGTPAGFLQTGQSNAIRVNDWRIADRATPARSPILTYAEGGTSAQNHLNYLQQDAIDAWNAAHDHPPAAIVWFHGEADSKAEDNSLAYYERFSDLCDRWRAEWPQVHIYASMIWDLKPSTGTHPHWQNVRDGMAAVASERPYVHLVESGPLPSSEPLAGPAGTDAAVDKADELHYTNASGESAIAQRFHDVMSLNGH